MLKERSESDGRQRILKLTSEGEEAFSLLNKRSYEEVAELLEELSEKEQNQLVSAMQTIESLLNQSRFKFAEPYFF